MDPNANLEEQLRLARRIEAAEENNGCSIASTHVNPYDALRLVELVIALDEWIRRGGALPTAWSKR